MIGDLLPGGIVAVESFGDVPGAEPWPDEERFVADAVPKRRREFATVRHCARHALSELGVDPAPLPRGERGAPRWPDGVVGSMTHCEGYRAAAVARSAEFAAVGIDAEPLAPLPENVLAVIATPVEHERVNRLAGEQPAVAWDRLWFSIKESVYKVWSPLTGRWLDFEAVTVDVDCESAPEGDASGRAYGTFAARLARSAALEWNGPATVTGRWLCARGLVLAVSVVRRDRLSS